MKLAHVHVGRLRDLEAGRVTVGLTAIQFNHVILV